MSDIIELNGPELWEIVYGVNDDAACSITDEQFDKIAEHIRQAFHATFWERIAALEAEDERLRKALEPFAKAADIKLCGDWRDDERFAQTDVGHYLTFGHLRAARAAFEAKP